jgi:hypothetical protein
MATYLQGVTDYIPDYQPFQPDLNFYANLLQTKQTQYDTNWNALNNLYGQLYGADLTHDQNIKKKDELLKQIDFNLKRVSGLDLSLEQNVNQAMQVFRPFYEDKYLIKDMAYTKNWKNTYANATALLNSPDEKQAAKYWDEGIRGLEYRRQMFKDATLDETLSIADAQYTPKVDVVKEYMDFAKKYDIGMVTQTPDGMYLVRKKNGEQLMPGLQQIFWAQYANRPDMQKFYKEKAFVERMDYANQNAEKFGGNKLEAEKQYIKEKYDWLKNLSAQQDQKAKDNLNTSKNLQANVQRDVATGNVNPMQKSYLERLNEMLNVSQDVENYTSDLNTQLNPGVGTSTVPAQEKDILANMELARLKVDAAMASYSAGSDINSAAGSYAYSNYEIEYKPDAVSIAKFREASANARLAKSHEYKLLEQQEAERLKRQSKYQEAMIAKGRAYYKADGSFEMNPQNSGFDLIFHGKKDESGQTSEGIQFDKLNQQVFDEVINEKVGPGVNSMMTYINALVNSENGNQFTNQQLGQVLNHFRSGDPTIDKIIDQGKKYPNQNKAKQIWNEIYSEYSKGNKDEFVKKVTKYGDIFHLNWLMKQFATRNNGNQIAQQLVNDPTIFELEQLGRKAEAMEITRANNAKKIKDAFTENLKFSADKLKGSGINVTNEQINTAVDRIMNEYVASGYDWDAVRQNSDELNRMISGDLGASFIKNTENKRDRSWWEYIPGVYGAEAIYDAVTGNRVNVPANWVTDILDKSYVELASNNNPDKGLHSFVQTVSRGGDMVSIASQNQTVKVDSDFGGDFGHQAALQAIRDALNLPQGADFNFAFSNNLPAKGEGDGLQDDLARSFLSTLYSQMGKSDLPDFFLSTSRVARESNKLGSTTFNIPRSIVEQVMKSLEGDYEAADLARAQDKIVQNGITVIAPHSYWTHKLWNASTPTATEIVLSNQDIKYSHPQNAGRYTLSKINGVPGVDYGAKIVTKIMDQNGNAVEYEQFMDMNKKSGQKIDDIERDAWALLTKQNEYNQQMFKYFYQTNNTEAIENAIKNFGINPNDPLWKY